MVSSSSSSNPAKVSAETDLVLAFDLDDGGVEALGVAVYQKNLRESELVMILSVLALSFFVLYAFADEVYEPL